MRFELYRIRINQGGYDDSGYYWGIGQPLYRYTSSDGNVKDEIDDYIRADDREHAKALVRQKHPTATFWR